MASSPHTPSAKTLADSSLPDPTPEVQQHAEAPKADPERSAKAWRAVAGSSAALFASFGWVNCIGVFQAEYETSQLKGYSSSTISWITSMEFFLMLFPSPIAGKLFDNYGPRIPIAIGTLVHCFGLMMASLSREYYQFMLSQSVCSGLGCAMIFTPSMSAPYTWFRRRRAIASGLTVAGSSLGGVIFPLMVQHLIPQVGFAWTMRICAFLVLAMMIFANLTISSSLVHHPRPFKTSDYTRPLRELNFCVLAAACFFLYWGMFVPFNYIAVVSMQHGMSPSLALSLIPILNGASFFGRTVPNYIADRVGAFNVMIVMTTFTAALVLALWLPARSNGAILTFTALFGIGSGGGVGLGPVLIAILSPISEVGVRVGLTLAIGAIGGLTGPPIAGAIAAQDGDSFRFACVFSGVSYVLSLCFVILRVRRGGWRVASKV
ncbi:major facilitator superfamily domain-containing protein [Aspergillus pseudonomiae]|uniref:Major facilitator superfamily domain-containing protein n=1 Tax=Aspergillus pseudonomiae TaxID=1506151 RepID=A0A5N7DBC0_9EURO|nr:major facilitator superfamily domain-containing protein [Aspergillus pseudonomiae]KAB8258846.1 major facilitator superfamily domain-containing protein [Aspergillus pseudonomiae]KAE8403534.1 major facilitator superfamily domain-containing protein [Aspergillus pseudonomiae]